MSARNDAKADVVKLTADVVLFAYDRDDVAWVLMIERGWAPFAGRWALPGGHVDAGETFLHAACRELAEETGIVLTPERFSPVGTVYDVPGRDPRGRYITAAFTTVLNVKVTPTAGDDAVAAVWRRVQDVLADQDALAFDHAHIILDAARAMVAHVVADYESHVFVHSRTTETATETIVLENCVGCHARNIRRTAKPSTGQGHDTTPSA
ncbi:MAG: NUDIX hydrolase [Actinomycetota bacterium]|nr:NUDIX hydrolase [Actinomycetota bacterium]